MKIKFKGKRASTHDLLMEWLRANIEPDSSLLDLGCGPGMYSRGMQDLCPRQLTVDAWDWVEPDVVANLEHMPLIEVTDQRWDYIFMLDMIEHLDKSAGVHLIDQCKQIVDKKIFLITPLPEIWNDNSHNVDNDRLWCHGNQYDIHKSSWTEHDFKEWTRCEVPTLENYFVGYYEA